MEAFLDGSYPHWKNACSLVYCGCIWHLFVSFGPAELLGLSLLMPNGFHMMSYSFAGCLMISNSEAYIAKVPLPNTACWPCSVRKGHNIRHYFLTVVLGTW